MRYHVHVLGIFRVAPTFITSPGIPDVDAYEVVIGGFNNTRSGIRRQLGHSFVDAEDMSGRLNCSFYEFFWITWSNGTFPQLACEWL